MQNLYTQDPKHAGRVTKAFTFHSTCDKYTLGGGDRVREQKVTEVTAICLYSSPYDT